MNAINELRRTMTRSSPILCPVRENNGLNLDISVSCSVIYDYKIINRVAYSKNSGIGSEYSDEAFEKQLKKETDLGLQIAFARITQNGLSFQQIQQSENAIQAELNVQMTDKWKNIYGVEICNITVSDITVSEEDDRILSAFTDDSERKLPDPAVKKLSPWMCSCGEVSDGRFCPECGQKRPERPEDGWKCIRCGTMNYGKFCTECGYAFAIS